MLHTEEIDDDYFTPASSTTLANIFGNSRKDDAIENESLKYTPPKPSHLSSKPEEHKATKCIFACALLGYEWFVKLIVGTNEYINRGKLAFAILNIIKTGVHNVLLYDSKKVILSSATISTSFEVTVKEGVYFSYLDNLQKYWSLYASEEELKKVIELLKSFNVTIKYSTEGEKNPADLTTPNTASVTNEHTDNTEKESDTDSSLYRKTKMSLLNRMANMGQSVLPPRALSAAKSSDSSDTNDSSHYKSIRHKPIKSVIKRNSMEKSVSDCQALVETQKIVIPSKETSTESMPLFTYVNGHLVPVTNSSIITSSNSNSGTDMNFFISEQRVNNSELRINMNRISDKVDQILTKVTPIDSGDSNASSRNFQVEILQKLLSEYENKIKVYEEIIKGSHSSSDKNVIITQLLGKSVQKETEQIKESIVFNEKINYLEQLCKDKNDKINSLEIEIKHLKAENKHNIDEKKKSNENLLKEIQRLNHDMEIKSQEYSTKIKMYENQCIKLEDENDIMGNKIKKIMNDTFGAILSYFDNGETYTGERIKSVTAVVIKRVTIEALSSI